MGGGFFRFLSFFLNMRRGLARLLKLYNVFILTRNSKFLLHWYNSAFVHSYGRVADTDPVFETTSRIQFSKHSQIRCSKHGRFRLRCSKFCRIRIRFSKHGRIRCSKHGRIRIRCQNYVGSESGLNIKVQNQCKIELFLKYLLTNFIIHYIKYQLY